MTFTRSRTPSVVRPEHAPGPVADLIDEQAPAQSSDSGWVLAGKSSTAAGGCPQGGPPWFRPLQWRNHYRVPPYGAPAAETSAETRRCGNQRKPGTRKPDAKPGAKPGTDPEVSPRIGERHQQVSGNPASRAHLPTQLLSIYMTGNDISWEYLRDTSGIPQGQTTNSGGQPGKDSDLSPRHQGLRGLFPVSRSPVSRGIRLGHCH